MPSPCSFSAPSPLRHKPVFLFQIWHGRKVLVRSEQDQLVPKNDHRDEGVDGLQLPALASERALQRGGVLRICFVGEVTRQAGPKPRPLGKILRPAWQ